MAERILGRQRIAGIRRKDPPHGVTIETWFAMCRMAELYRQHECKIKRLLNRPPKKTSCTSKDYLTEEETLWLFSWCKAAADTDRKSGLKRSRAIKNELLILLLFEAGLRVYEVCCLLVENCPPIQNERSLLVTWGTKRKKQRTVMIHPDLSRRIREFIESKKKCYPDMLAITNEAGTQFSRQSVWRKVKTIGRKAGIRVDGRVAGGTELTCHMGRHTAAMWLLNSGATLEEVAQQLGHEKVDTTRIYANSSPNRRIEAVDRLHNRLHGPKNSVNTNILKPNMCEVKEKT